MDYKEIKNLLEKYFEGTSDLREEKRIRDYFHSGDVHESLQRYAPLFEYLNLEQEVELPESFDAELMAQLEGQSVPQAKVVSLKAWALRVAAVVTLALGAWWFYPQEEPAKQAAIDWSKYEPETLEEAYKITKLALLRTSEELNKGARKAVSKVNKVREMNKVIK